MSRYLISFDMNTKCLADNYHSNHHNNAYADIKAILTKYGFNNMQGSVYLGDVGVSEAHGTMAIQELTFKFDWFNRCVSNIKFYRIESDLDAQFISDSTQKLKSEFKARIKTLEESLIKSGLKQDQIEEIINQQTISEFPHLINHKN